jgi:flagellar L-ring protein precursor FlgH
MFPLRRFCIFSLIALAAWCLAAEQAAPTPAPAPTEPQPLLMHLLPAPTGSLWAAQSKSLFLDTTAHALGDLLTIIIEQDSSSATQAKHETSKSIGVKGDPGTGWLGGFKGMAVKTERGTNGSGASQAYTRLLDRLTVTVTEVLPNGNLRVAGSRCITLEKDTFTLTFSGVVRLEDICPDNTVSSINIADQCLIANGNGPIAEKQRPGWFSRLLSLLW